MAEFSCKGNKPKYYRTSTVPACGGNTSPEQAGLSGFCETCLGQFGQGRGILAQWSRNQETPKIQIPALPLAIHNLGQII